ncbi:MAG: aspartate dehydrogenase [Ascidiaceihabitans sp.]|nr:aspartate dehydrogenase [Ascidiaceihabitans sp.]
MKIALIGQGAIAQFMIEHAQCHGFEVAAIVLRAGRAPEVSGMKIVHQVADLDDDIDMVVDCAGHQALREIGSDVLRAGVDLVTISIGALADDSVSATLRDAAKAGGSKLHLASGAIGALDCLRAAKIGTLHEVIYVGRKPPMGWAGSPAEATLDLTTLTSGHAVHFEGSARDAALAYPKNANVAAAVAIAGIGFDDTKVQLIADADVEVNTHEIRARGDFGSFTFQIGGEVLPGNPRTSALAAMSVVSTIVDLKNA